MTFESFRVVLLNDMCFEVPVAIILVQIELIIRQGIGTGQVHISVTIDICGGNTKTICISIIHQPFVKRWWRSQCIDSQAGRANK